MHCTGRLETLETIDCCDHDEDHDNDKDDNDDKEDGWMAVYPLVAIVAMKKQ